MKMEKHPISLTAMQAALPPPHPSSSEIPKSVAPPIPRRPKLGPRALSRAFCLGLGRACPFPVHSHIWLSPSAVVFLLLAEWQADSVPPLACDCLQSRL